MTFHKIPRGEFAQMVGNRSLYPSTNSYWTSYVNSSLCSVKLVLARPSQNKLICLSAVLSFVVKGRQNSPSKLFLDTDGTQFLRGRYSSHAWKAPKRLFQNYLGRNFREYGEKSFYMFWFSKEISQHKCFLHPQTVFLFDCALCSFGCTFFCSSFSIRKFLANPDGVIHLSFYQYSTGQRHVEVPI